MAEGVTFILGGEHRMDWITTYPFSAMGEAWKGAESITGHPASKGDIVVGNDVWIGENVIIKGGLEIGDGAIIAAGSIVTKNVEPYSVVAGVPAKVIRYRFTKEQIVSLLKIKWWEKDSFWLENHSELFSDIENFISVLDESN
jgi:acetyltransferase-like isoleucine patch superfamily enzyme